jgi:hypothetical protein
MSSCRNETKVSTKEDFIELSLFCLALLLEFFFSSVLFGIVASSPPPKLQQALV